MSRLVAGVNKCGPPCAGPICCSSFGKLDYVCYLADYKFAGLDCINGNNHIPTSAVVYLHWSNCSMGNYKNKSKRGRFSLESQRVTCSLLAIKVQ